MALTGSTNEEKIWNYLYGKIGNAVGSAALCGNIQAESGCNPKNMQDSYESKLGYNDDTYTAAVDNGTYKNFATDGVGYSLPQFTWSPRKKGYLEYAQSKGASIGDLETCLEYIWIELQGDYSNVLSALKSATDITTASNVVLKDYEAPADQGSSVQATRASYSQEFYDKYYTGGTDMATTSTSYAAGAYDKYIYSTGTHYISNSGSDENGKYSGGTAGDQTGNEWVLRSWYNRPWNCVLRYPDQNIALMIAELGCAAALNDKIGYDQGQRDTYWEQLKKVGYDPSKITTACESDCSAGVIANVKAVGYLKGISALQNVNATYTGNMRSGFKSAGFEVLTDSKYLSGYTYLRPGDILLNDSAHTATNVTKGSNASFSATSTGTTGSTGSTGSSGGTALNTTVKNYGVTNAKAPVRTYAGTSYSECSFSPLAKGTTVGICDTIKSDTGAKWYYILYNGKYGFTKATKIDVETASSGTSVSYMVKVSISDLNIRKGPGTNYSTIGKYTGVGTFTIVKESSGQGSTKGWGLLKSYQADENGWISLDYATKVN